MSAPSASMMVAVMEQVVCLKISGRANFVTSVDFKRLIQRLRAQGHQRFILDLTDCLIMDSTFLGVLARISMEISESTAAGPKPMMELLNPSSRVTELLENLGVLPLFRLASGTDPANLKFEAVDAATGQCTKVEFSRTCLEAHQTLMQLTPQNAARFRDVASFLAEDLRKAEAAT